MELALENERVLLRPPLPADNDPLYLLAVASAGAIRWRYKGGTPSPEVFQRQMWTGVLFQQIVIRKAERALCALIGLADYDPDARRAELFLLVDPTQPGHAVSAMEGLLMVLRHGFSTFGLHKVVITLGEDGLELLSTRVRDLLRPEGVRREHEFRGGKLVDVHHYALFADDWLVVSEGLAGAEEVPS